MGTVRHRGRPSGLSFCSSPIWCSPPETSLKARRSDAFHEPTPTRASKEHGRQIGIGLGANIQQGRPEGRPYLMNRRLLFPKDRHRRHGLASARRTVMLILMPIVVNGAPCFSSQCAVQEAAAPVIATASSFLLGVALRLQPQHLETATLKVCGRAFLAGPLNCEP